MKHIRTRTFGNGFVSLLNTEDGRPIETTATCLPMGTEIRHNPDRDTNSVQEEDLSGEGFNYWAEKYMIGISTQSGCPIKCKFCAVNEVTERYGWRNLTAMEMFEQVTYAIKGVQERYGYDLFSQKPKLFRILFTRMGEPALNKDEVLKAVTLLKVTFPNVKIQISTIGVQEKTPALVKSLCVLEAAFDEAFIEYQFSVHSTDMEFRKWLQSSNIMSNEELNGLAGHIMNNMARPWKVTLNFTLAKETPFDVEMLKKQFNNAWVFVKLSPINENVVSEANELESLFTYKNAI